MSTQGQILCTIKSGSLIVKELHKIPSCTPKVTQPVKSRDQTESNQYGSHFFFVPLTPPQQLRAVADSVFTVGGLARRKGACRINIGLISCKGQLCNIVYVFATPGEHSVIHI
jgi:hypothetical protein